MRAWFVGIFCALLFACGGNVVVDPGAHGTGAAPTSSSATGAAGVGGSVGTGMGNGGSTPVVVGGAGGGFTGMACNGPCNTTCAEALTNGGFLCAQAGQASDDHAKLMECVAMACPVPCSSFINGCPLDSQTDCPSCAQHNCAFLVQACANE
jgi:hypothetical protein